MSKKSMLDVDVRSAWMHGRTVFAIWFTAASLIGNCMVVRKSTRLSLARSFAAGIGMTGLSWLVICAVPIPLWVYLVLHHYLNGGHPDPFSWIFPVLMSVGTGALAGLVVLFACRQKITRSTLGWLLAANLTCIALAVYRMVVYLVAAGPEA